MDRGRGHAQVQGFDAGSGIAVDGAFLDVILAGQTQQDGAHGPALGAKFAGAAAAGVFGGVDATKGLARAFAKGLADVADADDVNEFAVAVDHLPLPVEHHGDDGDGV